MSRDATWVVDPCTKFELDTTYRSRVRTTTIFNFTVKSCFPDWLKITSSFCHQVSFSSRTEHLHIRRGWLKRGLPPTAVISSEKNHQTHHIWILLNIMSGELCLNATRHFKTFQPKQNTIDELKKVLKLNSEKTQFTCFGSRYQLARVDTTAFIFNNSHINVLSVVTCLGVEIDQPLTFSDHIRRISRRCFYWLRQFRSLRHTLTTDTTIALVNASVINRIDYCNAVLNRCIRHSFATTPRSSQCCGKTGRPTVKSW